MKDVLSKDFRPEGWQWQTEAGVVHMLTDLSRNDLLQVACACMQSLEDAEAACADMQAIFDAWRNGKPTPSR